MHTTPTPTPTPPPHLTPDELQVWYEFFNPPHPPHPTLPPRVCRLHESPQQRDTRLYGQLNYTRPNAALNSHERCITDEFPNNHPQRTAHITPPPNTTPDPTTPQHYHIRRMKPLLVTPTLPHTPPDHPNYKLVRIVYTQDFPTTTTTTTATTTAQTITTTIRFRNTPHAPTYLVHLRRIAPHDLPPALALLSLKTGAPIYHLVYSD